MTQPWDESGQPNPYNQPNPYDSNPYNYWPAATPVKTNGSAVASLVLGILSLVMCPLTAIPGLILGVSARKAITASRGAETGDGLAVAGIVTSALGLVFVVVGLVIVLFVFAGLSATSVSALAPLPL